MKSTESITPLPIRFNGLAIGTNELDSEAANGTIHALAEGPHFGQRGWYLSGSDGGGRWEYLPDLRASSSSLKERDGGDGEHSELRESATWGLQSLRHYISCVFSELLGGTRWLGRN